MNRIKESLKQEYAKAANGLQAAISKISASMSKVDGALESQMAQFKKYHLELQKQEESLPVSLI
jgi:hypothetical protein